MAAASKAYTTDDGKTSVKQDSSSASQMIAAATESPDGTSKSSMSYSSSSSSASSMVTSSSGGPIPSLGGPMPSLGGPMPSLGGGMLEMDDMMKKMMSWKNRRGRINFLRFRRSERRASPMPLITQLPHSSKILANLTRDLLLYSQRRLKQPALLPADLPVSLLTQQRGR